MKKNIFILLIIQCCIMRAYSEDTLITIQSLENKVIQVKIKQDYVKDKLTVSINSSSSFCISGFRNLNDLRILNNKFIMIFYSIRAGSGSAAGRHVFFCVSENKLYLAADISSFYRSSFKETYNKHVDSLNLYDEEEISQLSFFSQDKAKPYKLKVTDYGKVRSKYKPTTNRESKDSLYLKFDQKSRVFYSGYLTLNGSYIFPDEQNKKQLFHERKCPIIKLKKLIYLFLDGYWYWLEDDKLEKIPHYCN